MISYISDIDIQNHPLPSKLVMSWIQESFCIKNTTLLPHKTSIHFNENQYFNTMPAIVPTLNLMGVKIINRYPKRQPTVDAQILLYDYRTGNLTHILDGAEITAIRTGAVCALAVQKLAVQNFSSIAIMGLGHVAKFSMSYIAESNKNRLLTVKLYRYKDQAEKFIESFKHYKNISFQICDNMKDFITDSDVVISCITHSSDLLSQPEWFKKGSLLIPVHLRGFQNCDLVFDKIIVDDMLHVSDFQYFKQWKYRAELSDILQNKIAGRENNDERIISYNVGLAIHDLIFSHHIIQLLK